MTTQPTRQGPQPTWMRNLIKSLWLERSVFMPLSRGAASRPSANDIRERLVTNVGEANTPPLRTVQRIIADFREAWDVSQELAQDRALPFSAMGWPKDHDDSAFLMALIRSWGVEVHPDHWINHEGHGQDSVPADSPPALEVEPTSIDSTTETPNPEFDMDDSQQGADIGGHPRSRQNNLLDLLPLSKREVEIALQLKSVLGYPQDFPENGGIRIPWTLDHEFFSSPVPGELALIKELTLRQSYIESADSDLEMTARTRVYGDHSDVLSILLDRPWHVDSSWRNNTIFDQEHSFLPSVFWPAKCLRWNSIYLSGSKEQGREHFQAPIILRKLIDQYIHLRDETAGEKAWDILHDLCPLDVQWSGFPTRINNPLSWRDFRLAEDYLRFIDNHECFRTVRSPQSDVVVDSTSSNYDDGWGMLASQERQPSPSGVQPVNDTPLVDDSCSPQSIWITIQPDERDILRSLLSTDETDKSFSRETDIPYVFCGYCSSIFMSIEPLYLAFLRVMRERRTFNIDKGIELSERIINTRVRLAEARNSTRDYTHVINGLRIFKRAQIGEKSRAEAFWQELEKINEHLFSQRNQKTLETLDFRVSNRPNAATPLIVRGLWHLHRHNYQLAIADFTAAEQFISVSDAPLITRGFTHYLRGRAYGATKEYEKSVSDFVAAMELLPPEENGQWDERRSSFLEGIVGLKDTELGNIYPKLQDAMDGSRYGGMRNEVAFTQFLRNWDK